MNPFLALCSKVLAVLAKIDDWQFDSFELNEVTSGRPLSTLGFAIMTKCELVPGRWVFVVSCISL